MSPVPGDASVFAPHRREQHLLCSPPAAPSSRAAPANGGTSCRKKPLAAKIWSGHFPVPPGFMLLYVCSGGGKGRYGSPPAGDLQVTSAFRAPLCQDL